MINNFFYSLLRSIWL